MRDAQSLLEQLLSSGEKQLSSTFVHQTLGIAPDEGILDLIDALADRDAARALQLQHRSIHGGVQPGELLSGLIEFLRDVMVVAAGAEVDTLAATPGLRPRLRAVADRWPLDTILAALQILSETRMRMRGSPHGRILLELALCRIARLEDFSDLADLIARVEALDSGTAPAAPAKKKPTEPLIARTPPAASPAAPVSQPASEPAPEPAPVVARPASTPAPAVATPSPAGSSPAPATPPRPARSAATAATRTTAATASRLDLDTVLEAWNDLPGKVGASLGTRISQVRPSAFEPPDRVIVTLTPRQQYVAEACDTPHARSRLEAALGGMLGQPVVLEFVRGEGNLELPAAPSVTAVADRADELATNPFVEQICRLFEARRVRVDFEPET
jgi:DNA polymerase-3 subunit gamma/tau